MTFADKELLDQAVAAVVAALRTGKLPVLNDDLAECEELEQLIAELVELHGFALAVGCGDLRASLSARGTFAGSLKSLQAALRHLAWQTERIALGDFSQRIDFMGEFSAAFNGMVEALERVRGELDEQHELLRAEALELEHQATTDPLTGASNRRKFDATTRQEIERAQRYERPLSLFILDIDFFKTINDELGHEAGDQALRQMAALVGGSLRSVDHFARWGGDEFVVLLPEIERAGAIRDAERICALIEGAQIAGRLTASFGVAQWQVGETADAFFCRADRALYVAKAKGRNRVVADDDPEVVDGDDGGSGGR